MVRLVAIPPFPLQELHRFDHCFSAAVHLLIFFVRFFLAKAAAFPRSDNSIFTIPLGFRYEPVSLPVPVTQHGRSEGKFLLNHTDCALTHPYISIWSSFRPVHSRIRQFTRFGEHSNHRYFIDSWPIGSTICFQNAFGHHKW